MSEAAALSRRALIAGAAATVIGWNTATRSWATTADAAPPAGGTVATIPALDGVLVTEGAVRQAFGTDFGRLVTTEPRAVLRPGSVEDVARIIRYARRHRITVAMNGQSGTTGPGPGEGLESHSSYGQAAAPGGISIDARALDRILHLGGGRAVVEAGVTWARLTDAALPAGWMPPCLPDYLHLSIGGTLSVGGIGGGVQKHGLSVDTVESIDLVTGTGELVTASADSHRDLFEAALGGGGQVGVIVRATLRLAPARERALVFSLRYDSLPDYLADQERILADGRFDLQVGDASLTPAGTWQYRMEAVAHYDGTAVPDREALLRGLRPAAGPDAVTVTDQSAREYAYRVDGFAGYLKAAGFWDRPKPWMSVFLPASAAEGFIRETLAELTPADLGAGLLLLYPFATAPLTRPAAVMPDAPVLWHFDLLCFPGPGADDAAMLRRNRRVYDRAVALGGKRYLIGAIPDMTRADWQRHYGHRWGALRGAKHRWDPAGILTPGQGIHD
ncbi:FAD-binding protein [Kitasatospora sp. NPDC004240]